MHWLILIPYYFFGALTLTLAAVSVVRVLRLHAPIHLLVSGAVALAAAGAVVPPALGWIGLSAYTAARLLLLVAASMALAVLDAWLATRFPSTVDEALEGL